MNGRDTTKALFTLIYEIAISEIQSIEGIRVYVAELRRLCDCLEGDKVYKVDLKPFGWGK